MLEEYIGKNDGVFLIKSYNNNLSTVLYTMIKFMWIKDSNTSTFFINFLSNSGKA